MRCRLCVQKKNMQTSVGGSIKKLTPVSDVSKGAGEQETEPVSEM